MDEWMDGKMGEWIEGLMHGGLDEFWIDGFPEALILIVWYLFRLKVCSHVLLKACFRSLLGIMLGEKVHFK